MQGCACLAFVDIAAHLGVQIAPKTIFGAGIAVFQPNASNIETFILSKLLHGSLPNFAQ